MLTFSGFGWGEVRGMPTADDVWQRYMEANPKAKGFRFKPFKYYNELRDVFAGMSATGADAVPPSQLTLLLNGFDDEEPVDVSSVRKRPNSFSSEDVSHPSSSGMTFGLLVHKAHRQIGNWVVSLVPKDDPQRAAYSQSARAATSLRRRRVPGQVSPRREKAQTPS